MRITAPKWVLELTTVQRQLHIQGRQNSEVFGPQDYGVCVVWTDKATIQLSATSEKQEVLIESHFLERRPGLFFVAILPTRLVISILVVGTVILVVRN